MAEGSDHKEPTFEGLAHVELDIEAPLERENFVANAEVVLDYLAAGRRAGNLREGYENAWRYVDQSGHPQLALMTEVMLLSPTAAAIDASLEQAKASGKSSSELENDIRLVIRYGHAVRDLVYANPDTFTRNDLVGWLSLGGNADFAKAEVTGVAAEVAAARLLSGLKGAQGIRLSSVEEDLSGADLMLTDLDGTAVEVDVKASSHIGALHTRLYNKDTTRPNRLLFVLDGQDIEGFNIRAAARPRLLADAEKALGY